MKESWKKLTGIADYYEVSDLGNFRDTRTGKNLNLQMRGEYLIVFLVTKSKTYVREAHRLVAQHFINGGVPVKKGKRIEFKNNIFEDIRASNLRLTGSKSETVDTDGETKTRVYLQHFDAIYC